MKLFKLDVTDDLCKIELNCERTRELKGKYDELRVFSVRDHEIDVSDIKLRVTIELDQYMMFDKKDKTKLVEVERYIFCLNMKSYTASGEELKIRLVYDEDKLVKELKLKS